MGKHAKLSDALRNFGFHYALNTTERVGGGGRGVRVTQGTAFTHDYNNGVAVVYDEEGRPWIRRTGLSGAEIAELPPCTIKPGAYVPHSNDGGYYIGQIFPRS